MQKHNYNLSELYLNQNIPQFVSKIYQILQKGQFNQAISWDNNGQEIIIKDIKMLENDVLPYYFRHSNIKSFIRQLNIYYFHKTRSSTQNKNILYFKNSLFKKGDIKSLGQIKRKKKCLYGIQEDSEKSRKKIKNSVEENPLFSDLISQIQKLAQNHPELSTEMTPIYNLISQLIDSKNQSIIPLQPFEEKFSISALMQTIKQFPNQTINQISEQQPHE